MKNAIPTFYKNSVEYSFYTEYNEVAVSKYNKHWKKRKNTCIDISKEMSKFYI